MEVLVHVFVFEGIVGSFLRRGDGGIEVLELRGEAHADLEGVRHCGGFGGSSERPVAMMRFVQGQL